MKLASGGKHRIMPLLRILILASCSPFAQGIAVPSSFISSSSNRRPFPAAIPSPLMMIPPEHSQPYHPSPMARSRAGPGATLPIFGRSHRYHDGAIVSPLSTTRGGATDGPFESREGRPSNSRNTAAYQNGQGINLNNWTNRILALNLGIFLLQQLNPAVTLLGAKNDKLIRMGEYHRLFSPMLLHANLQHLMANSYSMYNIGHFLEPVFGGPTYLALYVVSGFCGNAMSYVTGTAPISIGASTAVSGLMGALGFFCLRHREMFNLEGPLRSVFQTVVINGVLGASSRNIDNFGHLGGLLGGIACGMLFGPRLVAVTNPYGQILGVANLPYLQSALARAASALRKGGLLPPKRKEGGKMIPGGPSERRGGPSPEQQKRQQQQGKQGKRKFGWIHRLAEFLDRSGGGREGGRGGRGYAFVTSPLCSSCSGRGRGVCRDGGRGRISRGWMMSGRRLPTAVMHGPPLILRGRPLLIPSF